MKIEIYLPDDISEFIEQMSYNNKICLIGTLKEGLIDSIGIAIDSLKKMQENPNTADTLANLLKRN